MSNETVDALAELATTAATDNVHGGTSAPAASAPSQPLTGWQKFKLVFKVVEVRLRFIAILVATAFFVGYWDSIKNHWHKETRGDGRVYAVVHTVLGESVTHWLWPHSAVGEAADSDTEFYCPMHPSVVRPGLDPNGAIPKCPICGMPLSQRKKGEVPKLPDGVLSRKQYSPEQIQLAGIKTVPVTFQPLTKEITTVGFVVYDESRLSEIVSRVSGYLEKVYVNKTWLTVKEGDPLAEIYSPELYTTARELLLAMERKGSGDAAKGPREKLRLLGIGDSEIDEIAESGKANHRLVIRAPQSGHIIRKDVKQGGHVDAGKTLFEVADLSAIWIEAEVFERDIQFLRVGQAIEATVEAFPNRVFKGSVSLVHPHLDPTTRTNGVRFDVENTNHELRPGMFASVRIKTPLSEIEPFATLAAESPFRFASLREDGSREYFTCPTHPNVMMDRPGECPKCQMELDRRPLNENERLIWWCPMHPQVTSDKPGGQCDDCSGMKLVPKLTMLAKEGEVLAVPERAVVDTGAKKIVYIQREDGMFEGVEVELGPRSGDYYPVVKGLEPGDRVAAAGAFLVDAETRLNPAAAATYIGASGGPQSSTSAAPATQPNATAADKQQARAGGKTEPPSADSKKPSPDDLKNISKLAPADKELALAQGVCPITDEPLGSMGVPHKMTVKGQPVFLCCKGCESEVNREPDKVLSKLAKMKSASAAKGSGK